MRAFSATRSYNSAGFRLCWGCVVGSATSAHVSLDLARSKLHKPAFAPRRYPKETTPEDELGLTRDNFESRLIRCSHLESGRAYIHRTSFERLQLH
jgi:hypothetical protein